MCFSVTCVVFKFKDMLEFFEYLYIDLKFKAISVKVERILLGIRLSRLELGLPHFLLCKKDMIDIIYLIEFCEN